jgi:hypothetical protein
MAQIIKHRRGSLEALSAVTSSLQKGELVIASGSSNLSVTNGASIVFAVPENGQVQAVNRFLVGNSAPNNFAAGTYNGMLNGVPYFASGSSTLYLLGEGANTIPNLVGNIQPFSSSVASSINALSASIGGGTIGNSVNLLNTFTGSQESKNSTLATYTGSVNTRLSNLETTSASVNVSVAALNASSASQQVSINALNDFSASENSKAATLATYTGSVNSRLDQLSTASGSAITRLTALEVETANLETFSGSQLTKDATLATYTGSVDGKFTTLGSYTASLETKNSALATITGSLITSASNAAVAIANLNGASGSYAKLSGGNSFTGQQTITGSLWITQNLIVQGSSSLQNITASAVNIGTNQININTNLPAVRYAGLNIYDSGSSGVSASFLWDSQRDEFIFTHKESGSATLDSSMFIYGPLNTGSLDDIAGITGNRLTKGQDNGHGHHITSSQISDDGTTVSIPGNLDLTGSIKAPQFTALATITGSLILSASVAAIANANQNTFTQSALVRLTNLETTSASVVSSVAALNAYTSSNTSTTALNTFTASAEGRFTTLATYTGSVEGRFSTLATYTGSVNSRLDQLSTASGSAITRLTALEVETANLEGFSSSALTRLTALEVETSNLETFSSSANTRFTEIANVTGSLISSASAAKTTNDSQGVSITNLNTFSASVNISVSNLNTLTASALTRLTALEVETSNLETFSSSALIRLSNLQTKSASVDVSISNINSFTSSFGTTFSSSVDSRLDTLEGTGTIQGLGTSNNVTFAKVTTTGDVIVGGDLVVQGNTVTLNTAQLVVEDKLITLASGSTSNATADGAGFEIAGTTASFKYNGTTNQFSSSVALASNITGSINLGSAAGSSKRVAFRNTNGNLDLVPTASVDGDLLQWNGTDFVMSNVIDGGSF